MIQHLFFEPVGWALIHFLWQAILIALAAKAIVGLINPRHANIRYLILCLGLFAMAISPVITTVVFMQNSNVESQVATHMGPVENRPPESDSIGLESDAATKSSTNFAPNISGNDPGVGLPAGLHLQSNMGDEASDAPIDISQSEIPAPTSIERLKVFCKPLVATLPYFWMLGVGLFGIRLGLGYFRVRTIRSSSRLVETPALLKSFNQLKNRIGLTQSIQLLSSSSISAPMVIGWFKPVVILPCSAITGLSPEQMTAILAHELSHIHRADYLVNLFQSLVETFLFYHPAVWWISNDIRKERENSCDDLVSDEIVSPRFYAESLLQLATRSSETSLALRGNGGDLLARIERICAPSQFRRSSGWLAAFIAALAIVLLVSGFLLKPAVNAMVAGAAIQESLEASDQTPQENQEKQNQKKSDPNDFPRSIEFNVTDENGKPVKDVKLHVGVWQHQYRDQGPRFPSLDYLTDEKGTAKAKLPESYYIVRVWARAEGYVPLFIHWEEAQIKSGVRPPEKYELQMTTGSTVSGVIVDDSGKPVEGAIVQIKAESTRKPNAISAEFSNRINGYITQADGRWRSDSVPPEDDVRISISVKHSDFPDQRFSIETPNGRAKTAKSVLQTGVKLEGTILNADGFAVDSGVVAIGNWQYETFPIGVGGKFETDWLPRDEKVNLTVFSPGSPPWTKAFDLAQGIKPQEIRLERAHKLKVKVVDESGAPIKGAYLQFEEWQQLRALYKIVESKTVDDEGKAQWNSAPADVVRFNVGARGYFFKSEIPLFADGKEHQIVLQRKIMAEGRIRDATTGESILNARVTPVIFLSPERVPDRPGIMRRDKTVTANDDGDFELEFHRQDCSFRLLFEAEGYQPFRSKMFKIGDVPDSFQVELKPATPTVKTIVDLQGNPIVGISAFITSPEERVERFDFKRFPEDATELRSDSKGQFKFQMRTKPFMLVAFSDQGIAELMIDPDQPDSKGKMTLNPWASLAGVLPEVARSQDTIVSVSPIKRKFYGTDLEYQFKPTSNHNFLFDRLPAGVVTVGLLVRNPTRPQYNAFDRTHFPVKLDAGEKRVVDFKKTIRFRAKFEFPDSIKDRVDLSKSNAGLRRKTPSVPIPEEYLPFDGDFKKLKKAFRGDRQKLDIITRSFTNHTTNINPDGSFELDLISPGEYVAHLVTTAKVEADGGDVVGSFIVEHDSLVNVPKEGSTTPVKIPVTAFPEPKLGELLPDFEFELGENKKRISEYRGKKVFLDIWSGRSKVTLMKNQKIDDLAQEFLKQPNSVVISLGSKSSGRSKRTFSKTDGIVEGDWISGVGNSRLLGLWRFPKYFVLDEEGKIVETGT